MFFLFWINYGILHSKYPDIKSYVYFKELRKWQSRLHVIPLWEALLGRTVWQGEWDEGKREYSRDLGNEHHPVLKHYTPEYCCSPSTLEMQVPATGMVPFWTHLTFYHEVISRDLSCLTATTKKLLLCQEDSWTRKTNMHRDEAPQIM